MQCEDVRATLWPEPGPRPATQEFTEAFRHYEVCEACQRFFAAQRALSARLARLQQTTAPASLRQRVQHAVASEADAHIPTRRRVGWFVGAGALVAAAATVIVTVRAPIIPERVASPLVEQAARALPPGPSASDQRAITTSDPRELRQWFATRIPYSVDIPQIDDAVLLGGRVADLEGLPTAAVEYLFHDQPVTYFALSSGSVMGTDVDWDRIVARSADGYELAVWQEAGLARAVVAAMPRRDLMRFAEECREKALRAI